MARSPSYDYERRERQKAKAAKRVEKTKAKAEKKQVETNVSGDKPDIGEPIDDTKTR